MEELTIINQHEYPAERVAWLESIGARVFDSNAGMLTFQMIFLAFPDTNNTAELDWGTVSLTSNPFQKQRLNALGVALRKDDDGLDIIKRFWENVYWNTAEDYPSSLLTFHQDGKIIAEWIRLAWW